MRPDRWFQPLALALLSVLLVGTLWVVPYVPTNDGPEWVFAVHAENHYSDPGAPYQETLRPTSQFASKGMSLVYGPLEAWLGWQRGLQVALSVVVLAAAWGFVTLVRAIDRERWPLGLLGFPVALSWELYIGLWPFVIAGALGLWILALAVRWSAPTWEKRVAIALLLLLEAVCHVFGAVLTGAVLLCLTALRTPRGSRRRELGKLLLTGLPAFGVLVASIVDSAGVVQAPLASHAIRLSASAVIASFPRTVAPGPLSRAIVATLLVLAAFVLAAFRVTRARTSDVDRGLGIAAVLLVLLGIFAPLQIPGWQLFSQRFVPLGVALVVAVVPFERLGAVSRRLASAALFGLAALSLAVTYPFHQRLVDLCPDAVAGLRTSVRSRGEILAFSLRATEEPTHDDLHAEVPFQNPLIHFGSLYSVVLGGVPAYSFAGVPAIHAFERFSSGRPLPDTDHYLTAFNSFEFSHDLAFRNGVLDELTAYALYYDEVILFGAIPSDFALFRSRGFVADLQSKTTLIAHFAPCTIDFTVPEAVAVPPPTFDVGLGTTAIATDLHVAPGETRGGQVHFALTPAPCGAVRVRARLSGDRHCTNASADGTIAGQVTRTASAMACDYP